MSPRVDSYSYTFFVEKKANFDRLRKHSFRFTNEIKKQFKKLLKNL